MSIEIFPLFVFCKLGPVLRYVETFEKSKLYSTIIRFFDILLYI